MCGTTTIDFSCGHELTVARADSLCAIAYSFEQDVPMRVSTVDVRVRLFCWQHPQGFVKDEGLCGPCRFRKEKYGTTDTAVSIQMLREAGDDIRSRRSDLSSADNSVHANSIHGRPSTDNAPSSASIAADDESSKQIGK